MSADPIIKICGITRMDDARHAVEHGASALGLMFWPKSPRYVTLPRAAEIVASLPSSVTTVGVFVDETIDGIRSVVAETGISLVQLHGGEPARYAAALGWPVMRATTVDEADQERAAWPPGTTFLLDAADPVRRGGTGTVVNWEKASALARRQRIVLAGGLTGANVAEAIALVRPCGVDVSSGVEDEPGIKNRDKVARFLSSARSAFDQRQAGSR